MPRKADSNFSSNISAASQSSPQASATKMAQLTQRGLLANMITSTSNYAARIAWRTVVELYKGEWILISDYSWESGKAYPRWVCIQSHASDHNTLLRQVSYSPHLLPADISGVSASTSSNNTNNKDPLIIYVDDPFATTELEPITARV